MKIFRIAIPIPFEDAVFEDRTEDKLDHRLYHSLTKLESDNLEEVLKNYGYTKPLGDGSYGVAYDIGNKMIAKLTTHDSEIHNANAQLEAQLPELVKVFEVVKINESVSLIIAEKITPLRQTGYDNYHLYVGIKELFEIYEMELSQEQLFTLYNDSYGVGSLSEKQSGIAFKMWNFLYRLMTISRGGMFEGDFTVDAHEENVGLKKNQYVLLDLGVVNY